MDAENYKIDLQSNKKSRDGSIMGKVCDFQHQLHLHDHHRLNILKKAPQSSACDRTVTLIDRFDNQSATCLMFGSNNYLGVISESRCIEAAVKTTKAFGIGSGGVPLLTGTNILQNHLEAKIAALKGFDDAILFSSGFTANIGAIIGLIRENNLIVHDKLNHASLMDGSLMSGAKLLRYAHNNPASLEKILKENHQQYPGGILVITDGVFSMDGDIANLPAIIDLVNKYKVLLLIDDAHATGVIGDKGKGSLSHYGLRQRENIIVTGTLSKAIGTVGGFIAAEQKTIDYLRIFARSNMYSTALPPSVSASSIEAINHMESSDAVSRLKQNADYMRSELSKRGYQTLNSETAIIPIVVKDEYLLTKISRHFYEKGILVNYIYPPVVSPGKSRIRISMMANHTRSDIDYFVKVLDEINARYGLL
jgi:glycine C-acetyltransferase